MSPVTFILTGLDQNVSFPPSSKSTIPSDRSFLMSPITSLNRTFAKDSSDELPKSALWFFSELIPRTEVRNTSSLSNPANTSDVTCLALSGANSRP